MPDLPLKRNPSLKISDVALGVRIVNGVLEIPSILFDNVAFFEITTAKELYAFVRCFPLTLSNLTEQTVGWLETVTVKELQQVLSSVIEEEYFQASEHHSENAPRLNFTKPDLKEVLMKLGNTLVTEYGYNPAVGSSLDAKEDSTGIVKLFTDWMNAHPEAQEVLLQLGFNWSMPKKKGT